MELGPRQKAWIKILRSGELKQSKKALCRINVDGSIGYCCLGVGCEVLQDFGLEIIKKRTIDGFSYSYNGYSNDSYLPMALYNELGLFSTDGEIRHSKESQQKLMYKSLAEANDYETSFEQIADFVEQYPETVFTKSI